MPYQLHQSGSFPRIWWNSPICLGSCS